MRPLADLIRYVPSRELSPSAFAVVGQPNPGWNHRTSLLRQVLLAFHWLGSRRRVQPISVYTDRSATLFYSRGYPVTSNQRVPLWRVRLIDCIFAWLSLG